MLSQILNICDVACQLVLYGYFGMANSGETCLLCTGSVEGANQRLVANLPLLTSQTLTP